MILVLISLAFLTLYLVYAISVIKSVPWSISDTYYQLEKRGKKKWLFQLAMIVPAMLLLPAWLECSDENIQFLAFLACGGLMFVGAAPCFKLELDGKVHYAATAICGTSAVLWTCFSGMWHIPLIAMLIAAGLGLRYRKWMFCIECAAFVSTYIAVILY